MFGMLEHSVAETMPYDVGCPATRGRWGRRPIPTTLFVADVEGLTGRVLNRVVVPGRQAEFM